MLIATVILVAYTGTIVKRPRVSEPIQKATFDDPKTVDDIDNSSTNTNTNTSTNTSNNDKSGDSEPSTTFDSENSNSEFVSSTGQVIDPDGKIVALTFDDGPCIYTYDILDVLEEYHCAATFFEVGNMAEKKPDALIREKELGCELGNHTYSHADLSTLSDDELKAEIDKANDVFISIIGEPSTLLRPPYGRIGDRSYLSSTPVVTWSVDTEDWRSRDADAIMQAIQDEEDLDGKVILMHSLYESSVEAVKRVVPYLLENGYQLVTVSELAELRHGEKLVNGELYTYKYFR